MLGRAQTLDNTTVVQTAPCCSRRAAAGQGLDNLPFFPGKNPLGCWHMPWQAPKTMVRRAASPLPSHPFLPSTVAPHYPGISSRRRARSRLVGRVQLKELGSSGCRAHCRTGYFLAFHLAACARIPNPLQPFACASCGAAWHVLVTLRASHQRQRMKSEACKYV